MSIEKNIVMGIAFTIVCICAVYDVKKKEIPLQGIVLGSIAGIGIDLWQITVGNLSFVETGLAVLPGCFLLLISFLTREKVGYGDGLLLVIIGLFTGFYRCMIILCISLILISISSLALLCMRKVTRNSRLPFVPFMALGMGVGFFV
ncbi:MAG: prepilin peptidase [Lachnospiraceae bacterium]|nr:prepilin peptidase [Lachnospiraceae bacterium]